jgi:hypothetical protein
MLDLNNCTLTMKNAHMNYLTHLGIFRGSNISLYEFEKYMKL